MKKVFLIIFLFQAIFFITVPPFQIPDESGHYENIIWLAKGKYPYQLLEKGKKYPYITEELEKYYPTFFSYEKIKSQPLKNKKMTEIEKKLPKNHQPINFQAYHPFLYYLLLTPGQFLANILDTDLLTRFYLTRLISSIYFWLLLFFILRTLINLKVKQIDQKTFFLFFGLNPIVLYYSIGINPDIGVTIVSSALILMISRYANNLNLSRFIILGIIAGLAYLSKTSGIINLIFLFLIIFHKQTFNFFKKIVHLIVVFFSFLIVSSPWLILHYLRYHTLNTPSFYIAHSGPIRPNSFFRSIFLAGYEFRHTIMHYSGFFGAQNQYWPPKIYFILFTLVIFFLFILGLKDSFKKFWILFYYLIASFVFFYILAFYFKISGFLWDVQGRHFLVSFFPFYFFVYQGLKKIFQNKLYFLLKTFSLSNIFIFIFFLMLPSFYPNKNIVQELNTLYPSFGYVFLGNLSILILVILASLNKVFRFLQVRKGY